MFLPGKVVFLQLLNHGESFGSIRNLGSKFHSIEIIKDKELKHPYSISIRSSSLVVVQ